LQPRAAPPEKTIKSQAALPERAELLREAGCLFVERGRVAVSMLQRQYSMDFDQACEVLDELQSLGLIGPYLGGQRRDILLTREQWLEKVGSV
jgi:S-DNA-T family DNA segregation ATPase FtsK/SpoIIIE